MKICYSNAVFIDTCYSLKKEFANDTSNTLLILGAIDFCLNHKFESFTEGYDKVFIYNQEPLSGETVTSRESQYMEWLYKADEVWDFEEDNIATLKLKGIPAKLHILKPFMDWSMYAPVNKDIDFLFVGTPYERRANVLDFLRQTYKVETVCNHTYGSAIDSYILRSKVLLNIHGTHTYQEQARIVKWLGAPCKIISEKSSHNYLNIKEVDYWELFCLNINEKE